MVSRFGVVCWFWILKLAQNMSEDACKWLKKIRIFAKQISSKKEQWLGWQ